MNLGWFHAERGRFDLALRALEAGAGKIGRRTLPYTRKLIYANWGNALARAGQPEVAREKYALGLGVDPDDADLLRDAGRVDFLLRDPAQATTRLRRARELAPNDADAAWLLAIVLDRSGADASAALAEALALDASKAMVAVDLARMLARAGRHDDAIALLEWLLALELPRGVADGEVVVAAAHAELGETLVAKEDVRRAIAELDRALEIEPDHFDANNSLGFLLATSTDPALHDPVRAVALAERAVEVRREYASLATLAVARASAGDLAAAVESAREALELAVRADDAGAVAALQHQLAVYASLGAPVSGPGSR
jgi:tetratricopeptide (TPR) repeat protein